MNTEFSLEKIVRENIKRLTPYSSARKEFSGMATVFLDANENAFGSPINDDFSRYPDPLQAEIKEKLSTLSAVNTNQIFVGNGSDEAIDLLFRIFCEPKIDNVVICPPTYGMYQVSAEINDVAIKRANLTEDFQLDVDLITATIDKNTKLLFICSPNNPSGNSLNGKDVLSLAKTFKGIIVVDEAYIHFSQEESLVNYLPSFPNLVVLQTFSKAWGLAGLRVGLAFASVEIVALMNKVKPPYNISSIAQLAILEALKQKDEVQKMIAKIIDEREKLIENLAKLKIITKIYPTDANFVLVKTIDANLIYKFLINGEIVVRNRGNVELCENCLRITIGTPTENAKLLKTLRKYEKSIIY